MNTCYIVNAILNGEKVEDDSSCRINFLLSKLSNKTELENFMPQSREEKLIVDILNNTSPDEPCDFSRTEKILYCIANKENASGLEAYSEYEKQLFKLADKLYVRGAPEVAAIWNE